MILSGALVAGTDAGYAYPTWPQMGEGLIPPGLYATEPAWLAAFEDITTIQFNHRLFAYGLLVLIGGFALSLWRRGATPLLRGAGVAVAAALLLQVTLGISTLLTQMAVPVAAAHQGGAILLLSTMLFASVQLRHAAGMVRNDLPEVSGAAIAAPH